MHNAGLIWPVVLFVLSFIVMTTAELIHSSALITMDWGHIRVIDIVVTQWASRFALNSRFNKQNTQFRYT
jgi:hypothetical protein